MFGEISLLAWMGSAVVFAIGGGAGFFIARQIKDKRTQELEQQLEATQNKLTQYQQDVNNHFLKTSLLFNKLTDNYKEVYEHLATGAQKLCNEKPLTRALDLPETKILAAATENDAITANAEKPQIDAGAQGDTHHEDIEHLGVESATITDDISAAQEETTAAENASPAEQDAEEPPAVEQSAAEASTTESSATAPTMEAASDTPDISAEELKALEANEKKKSEEEDVHLGAESTPGIEPELHKTHPSIH